MGMFELDKRGKKETVVRLLAELLEEETSRGDMAMNEVNILQEELSNKESLLSSGDVIYKLSREEVVKLKEENNNLDIEVKSNNAATKEVFDILKSTGIEASGFGLQSKTKSVIRKFQATIKESEAEANSYRDMYNELRSSVLAGLNPGDKAVDAHSSKEVLRAIECIKNERDIFDERLKDKYEDWDEYRLKYDRLIRLLNTYENMDSILQEHRDNEKKLKERRGK